MAQSNAFNSPVADLAARHLQHKSIALPPKLQFADVERAIAASGVGLDHTLGERAWAFGDASSEEDLKAFFLLTDRRLAGKQHIASLTAVRKSRFHAGLADITQVKWMSKALRSDLQIQTGDRWIDATIIKFTEHLGRFLDDLLRIPPPYRLPPWQPLLTQSQEDPTGLVSALSRIGHPHCAPLLQIINKKYQRGLLSLQPAADLTARVTLLDRSLLLGRGMREGWWLSPLSAADLSHRLLRMFGQPSASWAQDALRTFDFDLGATRGIGKAVASTAVGLAALGLLGVGWISTPGSRPLTHLRVSLVATPFSSSFTVLGANSEVGMQPLSDIAPKLLQKILSLLGESEAQLMFRRCVYGWEETPEQLDARSMDEINQKLYDLDQQG
jgi:hypothetical protein